MTKRDAMNNAHYVGEECAFLARATGMDPERNWETMWDAERAGGTWDLELQAADYEDLQAAFREGIECTTDHSPPDYRDAREDF